MSQEEHIILMIAYIYTDLLLKACYMSGTVARHWGSFLSPLQFCEENIH